MKKEVTITVDLLEKWISKTLGGRPVKITMTEPDEVSGIQGVLTINSGSDNLYTRYQVRGDIFERTVHDLVTDPFITFLK